MQAEGSMGGHRGWQGNNLLKDTETMVPTVDALRWDCTHHHMRSAKVVQHSTSPTARLGNWNENELLYPHPKDTVGVLYVRSECRSPPRSLTPS